MLTRDQKLLVQTIDLLDREFGQNCSIKDYETPNLDPSPNLDINDYENRCPICIKEQVTRYLRHLLTISQRN